MTDIITKKNYFFWLFIIYNSRESGGIILIWGSRVFMQRDNTSRYIYRFTNMKSSNTLAISLLNVHQSWFECS